MVLATPEGHTISIDLHTGTIIFDQVATHVGLDGHLAPTVLGKDCIGGVGSTVARNQGPAPGQIVLVGIFVQC